MAVETWFSTDAYNLFSATIITTRIELASLNLHSILVSANTALELSTTAGAILGQVVFGWLADKLGRKKTYGLEFIIRLIETFGKTISGSGPGLAILGPLIF